MGEYLTWWKQCTCPRLLNYYASTAFEAMFGPYDDGYVRKVL
jgi:hypothetical protein